MSTFAEEHAKERGIPIEEAQRDVKAWLSHKSNKERWIEEQERKEAEV